MAALVVDPTLEPLSVFGLNPSSAKEGILQFKHGLPVAGWVTLVETLGVAEKALAEAVQIPPSTLARRKKAGRFTPEESERLLRVARLVALARHVFQSEAGLARWFQQPNRALGGARPLEYASTPIGAEEVERVLERILDGGPA